MPVLLQFFNFYEYYHFEEKSAVRAQEEIEISTFSIYQLYRRPFRAVRLAVGMTFMGQGGLLCMHSFRGLL